MLSCTEIMIEDYTIDYYQNYDPAAILTCGKHIGCNTMHAAA